MLPFFVVWENSKMNEAYKENLIDIIDGMNRNRKFGIYYENTSLLLSTPSELRLNSTPPIGAFAKLEYFVWISKVREWLKTI